MTDFRAQMQAFSERQDRFDARQDQFQEDLDSVEDLVIKDVGPAAESSLTVAKRAEQTAQEAKALSEKAILYMTPKKRRVRKSTRSKP
jgi:hypothetical protein